MFNSQILFFVKSGNKYGHMANAYVPILAKFEVPNMAKKLSHKKGILN